MRQQLDNPHKTPIFFYDGDCGFCDATVQFFLNRTEASVLHFCALQSDYAKNLLAQHGIQDPELSTAYFYNGNGVLEKSDAIIGALRLCSTGYNILASILKLIPGQIRNYFYSLFARNRMSVSEMFKKQCRLLTTEERVRFIT